MRPCVINIVYDYSNKKHVFRLVTARRSAYLFEVDSTDAMLDWIRAIKQCSPADDEEVLHCLIETESFLVPKVPILQYVVI